MLHALGCRYFHECESHSTGQFFNDNSPRISPAVTAGTQLTRSKLTCIDGSLDMRYKENWGREKYGGLKGAAKDATLRTTKQIGVVDEGLDPSPQFHQE